MWIYFEEFGTPPSWAVVRIETPESMQG